MLSRIKRWRKMTWVLYAWTAVFAVWITSGILGANCETGTDQYEQAGCEVGTGVGVALVGTLGFMGFVVVSLIWFMTRPKPERIVYVDGTTERAR